MPDEIRLLKAEIKRLRKKMADIAPSLEAMLKLRGFRIYKREPSEDLLLPQKRYLSPYLEKLRRYSFRLFLRDVIKRQDFFTIAEVTRYATEEVTSQYVDFLLKAGVVERSAGGYRVRKRPVKSFGETLEWFVARLIQREFETEAVWGVKFKRPKVGGDYDLIAKVESSVLYMEIKSSPPKQIYDREITSFLNRVEDLNPDITIFFVDTELRMKDKIVPMFEAELQRRYERPAPVERIVKELFHINGKIFIINSKDSIESNIATVLSFYWNKK
ncbi:MAG: hypothetical protein C4560_12835 [Nitrospiraceae bacterium]|nr:MAG: hypothetical protein C4560_12835 [Nitrospiraceae bacterium]